MPALVADDRSVGSYPALRVTAQTPSAEFADLVAAAVDGFGLVAMEETDDGVVSAFFADGRVREAAAAAVLEMLPGTHVESVDVPDEDWAARSQASLGAIRVGQLTIAPPWDTPSESIDATVVIVPSMGFGTGHHATTRLCLRALQAERVAGKRVLDVGTGSGVLALAAAKLGAAHVLAIDNDPDAIANARENMALNDLRVDLRCEGLGPEPAPGGPFDVVLANLTGATLVQHAAALVRACAPRGVLIVSGLREEEEKSVQDAFSRRVAARSAEDGWLCLVLTRTSP